MHGPTDPKFIKVHIDYFTYLKLEGFVRSEVVKATAMWPRTVW